MIKITFESPGDVADAKRLVKLADEDIKRSRRIMDMGGERVQKLQKAALEAAIEEAETA